MKIAMITARGGSKRIPRKNIKDFCGKPIIYYSIKAAFEAGVFDEVMVSTDDEQIAKISESFGAKVPFLRSEESSNDFATTVDVIEEVLDMYESRGIIFDEACCIYPTAPFVTGEKLKQGMKKLVDADAAMPVVAYSFPPLRSVVIADDSIKPKWPEFMTYRSQDLETLYHDCGQFYCFRVSSFREHRNVIMGKTSPIVMDELEVQDIDNETDWEIAEFKYKYLHRNKKLLDF